MTIRIYSAASELDITGSATVADTNLKTARFELVVGHRVASQNRPLMRKIKWTVCGLTDAGVEACAVRQAEIILDITKGKAMRFCKILGHYRQDEELPVLAPNRQQFITRG